MQGTRLRRIATLREATATALATALVVAIGACGGDTVSPSQDPPPLRIGAIYNLSGAQAPLDSPSLDGARLAVDRINAGGGLLGRRVELLERDGQSDPVLVARAARSLVDEGVVAMIGLSDTDLVLAAAPVAAHAGVAFVTSGATSPRLPERVPKWLFLACFGDNAQAAAGADYAMRDLGARTAVILYDEDMDYARLLQRYFSRSFRSKGGVILRSASFHSGDRDASRMLRSPGAGGDGADEAVADASSADLLYVAAGPQDAGPLVRRLRAAGYRQPIMGGDSYDSPGLIAAAEATGGDVYYTTHAPLGLGRSTPALSKFIARFASAYGRGPRNAFACLGYDTAALLAAAIHRARSADPERIRAALQATRGFAGVTGTLSYAAGVRVPRKQVTVVRVGRRPELAAVLRPRHVPRP